MTSLPSTSVENQCSDVLTDAANLSKNNDVFIGHMEDDEEEDEEGDMDFNPFLREALFTEASSSLSSEIEECEFDGDVVESGEYHTPVFDLINAPDELQDDDVGQFGHNQQTVMQDAEEIEPNVGTNSVTNNNVGGECRESDDEDAIWKRTRARYSLVGSTLDELETFLQETDDEDDLHHNVNDEEEYRKFLAAVLLDGDTTLGAAQENVNADEDEDEDNDADFELELEELLGSDGDETLPNLSQEHENNGRRPETRQKKRQKTDNRNNKFSGKTNRPLVPILPYAPIVPLSAPHARNYMMEGTSSAGNSYVIAFTPDQIGQLHCLMYEHVQLLVQVFSLSVLEPSKQHVSTQVHTLLSEVLQKRDQVMSCQRVPFPSFCFSLPYIRSAVTAQNTPESSTESLFWVPFISENVFSVIDVAPLNFVQSYMDDVSIAVKDHRERQLEVTYDAIVEKECLFPFKSFHPPAEASGVSSDPTPVPNKGSDPKSKKTIAATLVERSKKESLALVPKQIAKLALRFFHLFNPALFPYKPPIASVANRVLFTDAEDGLLARGLMEHNTDWEAIRKNYLPSKTSHQIFVRQKNRACSKAPENPIKAVKRMKNSPLTPQEMSRIEEGLKIYKMDWMAVWKYMVPHRDPSLLSRQWRTAIGNQKSYKGDDAKRARRRLYESQRRKSKADASRLQTTADGQNREGWSAEEDANPLPDFPRCGTTPNKETCNTDKAVEENNSGDDDGNNEDETYVHEAFLSDWRPSLPNSGESQPVELFAQHRLINPNPISHPVPAKIYRSSEPQVNIQPYRAHVVKLAPDLPPLNLPPTVRIMSQSAFTKYQGESSKKARENVAPVEKGDSDLQMHPLLFQDPEDGNSLPYYPLHGSGNSCSSFDFFSNNSPQLNLNPARYSNQAKDTFNFFNNSSKSKELASSSNGTDFHPLLQRLDDGPIPHPPVADSSTPNRTVVNPVPRSPNELDLDIGLSFTARKENGKNSRESRTTETQVVENGNDLESGARSAGITNDEIVMEQEELSDSEDEETESVEFECEEMTDSEGEGGSDSDHIENMQNEDAQDDSLPKVMVHGDDSDQDEPRVQETSTSNMAKEKDEPLSLFGLSLNPKPPLTRNTRTSHPNSASKKTTLSQPQLDAATQRKKPRKRAQKLNPR